MKKIKSRLLILLSLTLFISSLISVPLYAAENSETQNDYRITYVAEEIKDTDALIKLAILQQKSRSLEEQNVSIIGSDLIANQLLEVKEYSNGDIEKSYASTGIVLSSERSTITLPEEVTKNSSSVSSFDVTAKFFYTTKGVSTNNNITFKYTYRVDKVQTIITKKEYSAISVTSGSQSYRVEKDTSKSQNFDYSNSNLVGQQTFTLNSIHSNFYSSHNDWLTAIVNGVSAESYVKFSNDDSVLLQFYAYRY